jgi:hypothetical protein
MMFTRSTWRSIEDVPYLWVVSLKGHFLTRLVSCLQLRGCQDENALIASTLDCCEEIAGIAFAVVTFELVESEDPCP